ncbi:MAG: hypothetical protein JNG85_10815 [Spirochaetaceae bacterium]|nr:hypothetical protein [Spirochaetaceae bacterium]
MSKPASLRGALLAAALAFGILGLPGAFGLEAKEGLVKIVINESTARLSVYRLVDVAKGRYEALVFDQDPRTSFATLSVDGKQYKLGDASDYRFTVSRTDTGARVEFRSAACVLREDIDFAKSAGAALADGLRLSFTMENVSQKDAEIGLRLLVDTWLAEKSGLHFRTDKRARVVSETAIGPADEDRWIATPGDRAELMLAFAGDGVDRPDRILLANWKRLNDEPWAFDVNVARNFTLLPYSVNDSALALYWDPVLVPRGGSRKAVTVLGAFNEKGYPPEASAGAVDPATSAIFSQTVLSAESAGSEAAMVSDLVAVRDLVSRIDRALSSGKPPSEEELVAWKKILDLLEERKKGY